MINFLKKYKRNLIFILCTLMTVTLTACGKTDEKTPQKDDVIVINETNESSTSEKTQKEEIVIGTLYDNQKLQSAVVAFNLSSDTYHVTVKTYCDNGKSYEDAVKEINTDIISGSDCPDILDVSQLNIKQLASQNVFEDLNPYLEKSTTLSKEDFIDTLLNSFTYEGILVAIPSGFTISTAVGKTSEVGVEMGWSLQDMIALAKEYPDSELFAYMDQSSMLYYSLLFNQDTFIDWSKGECHFESEEFKQLLECVKLFPREVDWSDSNYGGNAKVEEKQAGKILLEKVENIGDFYKLQVYPAMFGEEVTFIGFPTADGSAGCIMNVSDSLYTITTRSKNKDGAWEFIESYLATSADGMFSDFEFPSMKDAFQEKIDKIYILDANGERILDENGEPIPFMSSGTVNYDNWEYEYHTPTEEEINLVKELIAVAKPSNGVSSAELAIINMINEEAASYFNGQKSIEEVVKIIQSRVQLYISENS